MLCCQNSKTGDRLFFWNYGLGDNDYGSFHFCLQGAARSDAALVLLNEDGDLNFLGADYKQSADPAAWPVPPEASAREATAREVRGLIKFYQRVEEQDDYDEEAYPKDFQKHSTPVDVARFPREEWED